MFYKDKRAKLWDIQSNALSNICGALTLVFSINGRACFLLPGYKELMSRRQNKFGNICCRAVQLMSMGVLFNNINSKISDISKRPVF